MIDTKLKLTYCPECKESKEYSINYRKTCLRCKKALYYGCGRCMRLYKTNGTLKRHLVFECNKEPKFRCGHCDYKAHQKSNLERHFSVHYSTISRNNNSTTYKCTACGENFSKRSTLLKHLNICDSRLSNKNTDQLTQK